MVTALLLKIQGILRFHTLSWSKTRFSVFWTTSLSSSSWSSRSLMLKVRVVQSFKMLWTLCPVTCHNIPEELNVGHLFAGQEIELTMHDGTVRDLCFLEDTSNKSSLLITGGAGDCKIYVTDCTTGTPFQALSGHSGKCGGTCFVGPRFCSPALSLS
jgi:hypothetical protein